MRRRKACEPGLTKEEADAFEGFYKERERARMAEHDGRATIAAEGAKVATAASDGK